MNFVLDCSVTMSWCFEDEYTEYPRAVLHSMENNRALAPSIWSLEVANSLYTGFKKGRLNEAGERYFFDLIKDLPIETLTIKEQIQDLLLICKEHQLSSYDASYFYLAMSHNLPLATLNRDLRKAVLKAGGQIYLHKI